MSLKPRLGNGRIRERNGCAKSVLKAEWSNSQLLFDHSHWTCEATDLRWSAPYHLIVLTETGTTAQTKTICDAEMTYEGRDRPGALTFVPANLERVGSYREVGWFMPPDPTKRLGPMPQGPLVTQTEDVLVDRRGNIYITDKNQGLWVLRYTGPKAG